MEDNKIQIMGSEYSIFDYNLNKQFSNVKKIIITSEVLLNSFENSGISDLFDNLSKMDEASYEDFIRNSDYEEIFQTNLSSDFYRKLQENLNKFSNDYVDVKLDNYNFMNSVSNSKYNITIRGLGFSNTSYYEEKGQLLFEIKNLIKSFITNKINLIHLSQIKRFQIEIFESEEVYKNIFLKKEGNSIILSSSFGFMNNSPMNFVAGSEFYFSIDDDFKFYKNNQSTAIIREHNKLKIKEINLQEKVLSNDELILINKLTKNIHDALIELYINDKGKIKILNVSNLENSIYKNSEVGFFINKSKNNYDRISLLTLRDSLDEDLLNPKYILIRNEQEISEFLQSINIVKKVDGVIFTSNFYNPVLDYIGKKLDIDILFLNKNLNKTLDIKLDIENVDIDSLSNNSTNSNPFSSIISNGNKKNDEFLEKLKNINLDTPKREENSYEKEKILNATESLISSKNSSINKSNSNTYSNSSIDLNNGGKKLTAMQLLAQSVLNPQTKVEEPIEHKVEKDKILDFSESSLIMKDVHSDDLNPISNDNLNFENSFNSFENSIKVNEDTNIIENKNEDISNSKEKNIDIDKYENILATKLITTPKIKSGIYFTDMNSISQITEGEIYYMSTSNQNLNNSHLNYIVPISIDNVPKNIFLLISSMNDFFLIKDEDKNKYFISISHIEESMKISFIENVIKKLNIINLIISKKDLDLIGNYINKIDRIFIKDLEDQDDYEFVKTMILSYEKKYLMRNH